MNDKPVKFRVSFYFSHDGKLRTKTQVIEAASMNGAIDKLKRIYGIIRVTAIEKV